MDVKLKGARNRELISAKEVVSFNKKKFRFSDWFAEKAIKAVAFLSIAIVILIFVFVFREALPIFKIDKNAKGCL